MQGDHSSLLTKFNLCCKEEVGMCSDYEHFDAIAKPAGDLFSIIQCQPIARRNVVKMKLTDYAVLLLTVARNT